MAARMSNNGGASAVLEPVPPRRINSREPGSLGYWLSAWLPVAVGVGIIFLESTAWFGADRTSGPLRALWQWLFGAVSDMRWDLIHHLLRKSGHFIGYGCIALAWLRAWWMTLPGSGYFQDAVLAVLGTGLLATWDEWHQSLLPNRTSSPWDVLLDCCGGVILCLVTYGFWRLFRPERLTRRTS